MKRIPLYSFFILSLSAQICWGAIGAAQSQEGSAAPSHGETRTVPNIRSLSEQYSLVHDMIPRASGAEVNREISVLREVVGVFAFSSFEKLSLELLAESEARAARGEVEDAKILLHHALSLSPGSAEVALRGIFLVSIISSDSRWKLLAHAVSRMDFADGARLFGYLTPIVLSSITLGLFLSFALALLCRIRLLMRKVDGMISVGPKPFITPVLSFLLLTVPLIAGPLWALLAWGLLLVWVTPLGRKPLEFVGILLLAWVVITVFNRGITRQINSPEFALLRDVTRGDFSPTLERELSSLERGSADLHSVVLARGFWSLLIGDGSAALTAFNNEQIEQKYGARSWLQADKAIALYLQRRWADADQMLRKAFEHNLRLASLIYIDSKAKLELLDPVGSEALLREASHLDPEATEKYKRREESVGVGGLITVEPIRPSLTVYLSVLFGDPLPYMESFLSEEVTIMPSVKLFEIALIGLVLIVAASILRAPKKKHEKQGYFPGYLNPIPVQFALRLCPAGHLFTGEKFLAGFKVVLLWSFLAVPILIALKNNLGVINAFPMLKASYVVLIVGALFIRAVLIRADFSGGRGCRQV